MSVAACGRGERCVPVAASSSEGAGYGLWRRRWLLLGAAALLLGLLGLAVAGAGRATERPAVRFSGEVFHIWAGQLDARCTLQLAAFADSTGEVGSGTIWSASIDVVEGRFDVAVPATLIHADARWLELALSCPDLEGQMVRLSPRVELDVSDPSAARLDASAYLCVTPGGGAHDDLVFRSGAYTLYGVFTRPS